MLDEVLVVNIREAQKRSSQVHVEIDFSICVHRTIMSVRQVVNNRRYHGMTHDDDFKIPITSVLLVHFVHLHVMLIFHNPSPT